MTRTVICLVASVALFAGCASDPVIVDYKAPESSQSDWFPIPDDAPSSVEITSPDIPRADIAEIEAEEASTTEALTVEWLEDSLGNVSLKLNRQPGAAWELVESALDAIDIDLDDKNREEYMFELSDSASSKGLFGFFAKEESLKLVLIPQGNDTVLAIEGADEVVVERSEAEKTLSQLLQYFEHNG